MSKTASLPTEIKLKYPPISTSLSSINKKNLKENSVPIRQISININIKQTSSKVNKVGPNHMLILKPIIFHSLTRKYHMNNSQKALILMKKPLRSQEEFINQPKHNQSVNNKTLSLTNPNGFYKKR